MNMTKLPRGIVIALLLFAGQLTYLYLVADQVVGTPFVAGKALLFPLPLMFAAALGIGTILKRVGTPFAARIVLSGAVFVGSMLSIIWAQQVDDYYSRAADPFGDLLTVDLHHLGADALLWTLCATVAHLILLPSKLKWGE